MVVCIIYTITGKIYTLHAQNMGLHGANVQVYTLYAMSVYYICIYMIYAWIYMHYALTWIINAFTCSICTLTRYTGHKAYKNLHAVHMRGIHVLYKYYMHYSCVHIHVVFINLHIDTREHPTTHRRHHTPAANELQSRIQSQHHRGRIVPKGL